MDEIVKPTHLEEKIKANSEPVKVYYKMIKDYPKFFEDLFELQKKCKRGIWTK